ncbi:MAG: hypothetical protein KDK66_02765 [Deltaproteobacteria bacterium]|nr:hypothetical protein [Deltaproteobacteria bacterium]
MKKLYLFLILVSLLIPKLSWAGRSYTTTILNIIVKEDYIEIYTAADGGCGSINNRWHLLNSHPNFNALYSGLLASKVSGKQVDIVGNNVCGVAENISWAYVVK